MTREEQIKEITILTCPAYCRNKEKKCAGIQECDMKCLHYQRCEIVYDSANYHKQEKVSKVSFICDDGDTSYEDYKCGNCGCRTCIEAANFCPKCGAVLHFEEE